MDGTPVALRWWERDEIVRIGRALLVLALVVLATLRARADEADVSPTASSPRRPNVVLLVADDLRATRAAGAHEVILGLDGDHCLHEVLEYFAALAEATDLTG